MDFRFSKAGLSPAYIAWIIFFSSLALKFFYFLALDNPEPYPGDSFYYIHYADNLIQHGVFSKALSDSPAPDSYWAPGYPFFLAMVLKLADFLHLHYYPSIIVMQALLGGLIVTLTFLVGRFFLPTTFAVTASILTAFSPHLMTLGAEVLSEILLAALLLSAIYFYIKYLNNKSPVFFALLCGVIFGLSYLTNPVVLFIPFILLVRFLFVRSAMQSVMPSTKFFGVLLGCFLVIVISWSVRNIVSVAPDQMSSAGRAFENLVIGSHYNYHKMWRENPRDPNNPADLDMKKYKEDHAGFYQELISRVSSEPMHYLGWYMVQKPLDLWGWKIFVGRGGIFVSAPNSTLYDRSKILAASLVFMQAIHYWLFGLALIGLIFALKESGSIKKESVLAIYISVITISAVYVVLHADARYSVPMRPEMYLCAMYAIYKIVEFAKSKAPLTKKN